MPQLLILFPQFSVVSPGFSPEMTELLSSDRQAGSIADWVLAYNPASCAGQLTSQFYLVAEEVKRSMEWLIKRLIKVGARVSYQGRRWQVHVASALPMARHYRAVFG